MSALSYTDGRFDKLRLLILLQVHCNIFVFPAWISLVN